MSSLVNRYSSKLISNIISIGVGILTMMIIPRYLGPALYGIYELVNVNILAIISMANFGVNYAFISKIAKRPSDMGLVRVYVKFMALSATAVCLVLYILIALGWFSEMLDYGYSILFLGLIFSILTGWQSITREINDAYSLTVSSEKIIIFFKAFGFALLLILVFTDYIGILSVYMMNIFVLTAVLILLIRSLIKNYTKNFRESKFQSSTKHVIREFWIYSRPLLIVSILTGSVTIYERGILEKFSGTIEQGYFSIGLRLGSVLLIFASALTPLLLREVAYDSGKGNYGKALKLLTSSLKGMSFLVSVGAIFLSAYSFQIIDLIYGAQYHESAMILSIMAFYPIYQVYGQYTEAYLLASGETKVIQDVTKWQVLITIILTWFFIAPAHFYGLGMNGLGLALSTVISTIFAVSFRVFKISKLIDLSKASLVLHQVIIIGSLFFLVKTLKFAVSHFYENHIFFVLIIYLASIFMIIRIRPVFLFATGIEFEDFMTNMKKLINKK